MLHHHVLVITNVLWHLGILVALVIKCIHADKWSIIKSNFIRFVNITNRILIKCTHRRVMQECLWLVQARAHLGCMCLQCLLFSAYHFLKMPPNSKWPPEVNSKFFVGAKTVKLNVRNYSYLLAHSPLCLYGDESQNGRHGSSLIFLWAQLT